MKNIIIIFLICLAFFGCAKKNYTLDTVSPSKRIKSTNDSTGSKKIDIVDKSIIITEKTADSTMKIGADSLTGTIHLAFPGSDSLLVSHFENDALSLDFSANKKTGVINATARSKPLNLHFTVHEKSTTNNDIHTVTSNSSKVQSTLKTAIDSVSKKETKRTDPSAAVTGVKTVLIWILIILILCGAGIYFGRKIFKNYIGIS